ncbi:amino acid adenylation domain-containing protein [Anaerosacchariphilus polymeriproducens]|uniref:Amino acid adenylation domain-containing protein n=1 Tax=Anaerosacchariphilus polymeriproducens TaxID=1812858 RepID=A0A371AT03_9FIRM|nr:amino acid adenylation domain-containing protein [Anaerosacchariphilus polymeriproducens]RDU22703.1 amino acid adenylation domain-containing protein [Anaerosacchariphilus polymeriproducens]
MITNVLEYLESTSQRFPDKKALEDIEKAVDFKELKNKATSIGTDIAYKNLRCEPIVVLTDRNIESIIAFWGIIYSGNFYVPVDKKLPKARIKLILENIKPKLIIATKMDIQFVEEMDWENKVIYIEDAQRTKTDSNLLENIRKSHIDSNPLYTIFTSGSTGIPKGVVVSHRSVIDLIEQFTDVFRFSTEEVFGNQAPFDFDVSVKDIFLSIRNGSTLQIIPQSMFSQPKRLIKYLNEREITTLIWAASAISIVSIFDVFAKELPKRLEKVMFSGEVLPIKDLRYWQKHLPDVMYVNLYGPTEITCNCTYYIVDKEYSLEEPLPIGEPFPNTEILLLDDNNERVLEGESGEICVRGTCVAMGYYGNWEKTNENFCQNPLNQFYTDIIYRTGDFGRRNHNGQLVFISRKDSQIKHMGHRIELGEIETILNAFSYMQKCCCMYDDIRKKIVLFYQAEEPCDRTILKDLKQFLPKYMCPNQLFYFKELPMNQHAKIDRTGLKKQYMEKE